MYFKIQICFFIKRNSAIVFYEKCIFRKVEILYYRKQIKSVAYVAFFNSLLVLFLKMINSGTLKKLMTGAFPKKKKNV